MPPDRSRRHPPCRRLHTRVVHAEINFPVYRRNKCCPGVISPTPSAPSAWTRCRRPIRATPARRWAWPISPRCCGTIFCATTRPIRSGRIATASSCPTATDPCCSTHSCTSPATTCRWTRSSASASSTRRRPGTRNTAIRPASRPRPVRSARASPTPSAWPSPNGCWRRRSTAANTISSITTPTCRWATAA